MHDTLVGVDIAKAVLQLALSSQPGRFDSHRRLSREQFLPFVLGGSPINDHASPGGSREQPW